MRHGRLLAPLFLGLFMSACTGIPIEKGQILDMGLEKPAPVSEAALMEALSKHPVVFVGEKHDDAAQHKVQLAVIKGLHERGVKLAVALEMFPRTLQPVLDRYNRGELSDEAFQDETEWYSVWGFPADLYFPIFRYCRENGIPLVAMNLPRETVSKVFHKGLEGLTPEERETLPQRFPISPAYRERLEETFAGHGMGQLAYFIQAQGTWDSVMADTVRAYREEHPDTEVVGLVGGGHLMFRQGILEQLAGFGLDDAALVMPWSVDKGRVEKGYGDYVWGVATPPPRTPKVTIGVFLGKGEEAGGAKIRRVIDKSPAAQAGFQDGDVVVELDGAPVVSRHALMRMLRARSWGETLRFQVVRKGERLSLEIPLPDAPPPQSGHP